MNYSHVAARVFNTPLLTTAPKAEIIASVVLAPIGGEMRTERMEAEEEPRVTYAGLQPSRGSTSRASPGDRIAVVNVEGSLVHRATGMRAMSGMRSYADITEDVDAAVKDPSVRGIFLRIDSSGGEVSGAFDAADVIHAAAQRKPVWAIAEDSALSAAYLLGSQATKFYMTQSALVGSIGVVMLHHDLSNAHEKAGVRVTTLYRGDRKADMSPHAPLSNEARQRAEELLGAYYDKFVDAVARGRRITTQAVRQTQAGIFMPKQAMSIGLADGIGSYRAVLEQFAATLTGSQSPSPRQAAGLPAQHAAELEAKLTPEQVREHAHYMQSSQRQFLANRKQFICELCEVAGQPGLASSFLAEFDKGKPMSELRPAMIAELKALNEREQRMSSFKN